MAHGSTLSHSHQTLGRGALARAVFAAFAAAVIGIGLSRFAYTPILPAIIEAHWFPPAAAAYLGAANLAGYVVGALLARWLAGRFGGPRVLQTMMAAATLCFFASAVPISFAWFFAWRFLSGLAGGALIVLAAPAVLPHVPPARRGLIAGLIFMGVGLGVVLSGSLVPLLLGEGLRAAWLGLGGLSLLLTLLAWGGWPEEARTTLPHQAHHAAHPGLRLRALYAEYALNAVGWVPHMLFLVDFVARGLGRGEAAGAAYWVLFGIGAMAGPILVGHIGDRIGFRIAMRGAFVIEIGAILLPRVSTHPWALIPSSLIVGAFVTGTVSLTLGRIHELLPGHALRQRQAWAQATVSFALLQAAAAYGFSFLFARTDGDYGLLFLIGAGAMLAALVIDIAVQRPVAAEAAAPPAHR
ncbi:YbfB/YjiJ family MFS transporter [Acidisoma sp. C75]